ncbi:AAA family ATPase [Longimicrobium sp.]|jgi:hypothetical protein|uniref:AAA family ATPase n=1 Tax=Longimicrobium sp. TaxID=2029185 RepID=UPI002ED8286E
MTTVNALSMLVHGPSKAGKSLLGASTPWPRVMLDVESAARFLPIKSIIWDPIVGPPPAPKIVKGEPEWDTAVVPTRNWSTALQVLDWLKQGEHPFRSATVDSISELQYRYVEHASGREQMKIQDWGAALREVGGFVRDLRDLTMHPTKPLEAVVLTSMTKEDQQGTMRPYLQGQLATQIPYLMDVTAWIYVEPDVNGVETRFLQTRRMNNKEAGERVGGRIPPIIQLPQVTGDTEDEIRAKNVTFEKLIKMVYKGRGIAAPAHTGPTQNETPVDTAGDANTTTEQGSN